jgi:hypothetical protein
VRRPTLITIIVLFALLIAAAIYQGMMARGPHRYPGPGFSPTPTATAASPSVPGASP